ncbi:hypothetical protein [Mycolicibacterium peregrinum]|uniref:DNA polymerase III beta sliding clamp central domain-containing protein n=1 Tax=Mycolicibacterium peregrinum TaxID=43304 RepID=A0A4Z0HKD2_MYCPR|nr:hypothetical protein [Mycolicibacterium peregrinum]TGB37920.1 hypothetical protein EJD98_25565 [Mycolicibacterium peregrinum]TGB38061.1 hypothetical protein EJD94_25000 [Mycolicibacterium peregrinum]
MTVQLMTNELIRILKDAQIFASLDSTLPSINAVHLEARPGELIAVSTDRFVLGVSKAPLDEGESFEVALPLHQVKSIVQLASACKQAFSKAALKVEDKRFSIAFSSGETLTLPVEVEVGPHRAWMQLLSAVADEPPSKLMEINPQLLAKFARVSGAKTRLRLGFFGPSKPIRASIGDDFVGLIMPVRIDLKETPEWTTPDWAKQAPEKPKRKPRAKKATAKAVSA